MYCYLLLCPDHITVNPILSTLHFPQDLKKITFYMFSNFNSFRVLSLTYFSLLPWKGSLLNMIFLCNLRVRLYHKYAVLIEIKCKLKTIKNLCGIILP